MSNSTFRRAIASLTVAVASVGLVVGAPAAAAGPEAIVASVAVHYADLDLDATAGARTLVNRIASAAKKACGKPPSHQPMDLSAVALRRYNDCRITAVAQAVASINHPRVTAVHEGWQSTNYRIAKQ